MLEFGPDVMIDAEEAKNIAKMFLEQHHRITDINATIEGKVWKILVNTFHEGIEVSLDAEDGRILGYIFLKGK